MTIVNGPSVVLGGIGVYLDAANPRSYSGSGTSWQDLSLNQLNFSLNNSPSWSTTQKGMFEFSISQSASLSTSPSFLLSSGLTVSAWIKVPPGAIPQCVISHSSSIGVDDGWKLMITGDGTLGFSLNGNAEYDSTIPVVGTDWKMISVTATATNLIYYVNSNQVNSQGSLPALGSTPAALTIATDSQGNSLVGSIASIAIYQKILSQENLEQNFNAFRGRFGI